VSAADEAFATLKNRQPTDKERQNLMRERDALGVKDNDALWRLLVVLGHYETLYAEIPTRIAKVASDVTANVKAAAEAELKAAAARTRAELAKSVAETALEIANRRASVNHLQWITSCAFVLGVMFLSIGTWSYLAGTKRGDASGYDRALSVTRDEKAAAAWANTPEGQLGYGLAKVGSLREVATCSGKIFVRKGDTCIVRIGRDAAVGWKVPTETMPLQ
jgi:hypothetical protein